MDLEFDTRAGFRDAVARCIADAAARRARRLTLVDQDFVGWPLEDAAVLDGLARFALLPERRIVLIAQRFDAVQRDCARFVQWRRTWSHVVQPLSPPEDRLTWPTLVLADAAFALRVFDRDRWRGRVEAGSSAVTQLAEEIDAFAQRCEASFPANVVGL
jgi:hypothetical protein